MTLPRRVVTGTFMVTRRCAHRQYLLRPDEAFNQGFTYCLALAAERFDVLVHGIVVMSNHYHLVITLTKRNLPRFMHWLNRTVANFVKALRGHDENVWSTSKYSAVPL